MARHDGAHGTDVPSAVVIDAEKAVTELQAEVVAIRAQARACIERFRATDDEDVQYLLSERLAGLGSMIVPYLHELVLDDPEASSAQRYFAARVATQVGDRGRSVQYLCREVTSGSPYALPAAHALGTLRPPEGAEAVTEAIRGIDASDTTNTIGWMTALRDVGGRLPPEVRQAIETRTAPWAAAGLLADFPD